MYLVGQAVVTGMKLLMDDGIWRAQQSSIAGVYTGYFAIRRAVDDERYRCPAVR